MAGLLAYPDRSTRVAAEACSALLRDVHQEAFEVFGSFLSFLNDHPLERIEEIYTATFDLQPTCHPYVGYQLCGENQKRALFLMKLQQLYRQHDFSVGTELPDHIGTLLHFVAGVDDPQCCDELIQDGILPALDKMLVQAESTANPYIQLLHVVRLALPQQDSVANVPPAVTRRKEACT